MISVAGTKHIVAYHRVSSLSQSGVRHVSIETQQRQIVAYASRIGGVIIGSFTDVDSGRKVNRREYQEMLEFARAGNVDCIAVQWLDRFGRSPREILTRIWELQALGVEVVATDEDIGEEMVLLVRAGIAGAESKRTGERVKETMKNAARKGVKIGKRPYGYQKVMNGGQPVWEQESREASAVREMFRLAVVENLGFRAIAERLNRGYWPTPSRVSPWAAFTVQRILRNEALMGTMVFGKQDPVRIEGFYPEILSSEEWDTLQARLAIRRENARGRAHWSDYLLSGIAKCGYCGGPMVGGRSRRNGRTYASYHCGKHNMSSALCRYPNYHSSGKLEEAVLDHLGQYSNPDAVHHLLVVQQSSDRKASRSELGKANRELAALDVNLKHDVDLLGKGLLDEREFAVVNQARRERRQQLIETVERLTTALEREAEVDTLVRALPEQIKSFTEAMHQLEPRLAKAQLQTILRAARVKRDTVELEFRA